MNSAAARRIEQTLLRRYAERGDFAARDEIIERTIALVHLVARRYANRGVEYEELVQVGSVGLVKAVDRFDPDRGLAFSSFAVPNITGEIRRYFRDHSRSLRTPRDVQEQAERLSHETDRLVAVLQRQPTVAELAEAVDLPMETVLDVQAAVRRTWVASLDEQIGETAEGLTRLDAIGTVDPGYDQVEVREVTERGLAQLQEREQMIVRLRFEEGLTQAQVAERVGVSQMHVSRLLRRSLEQMRDDVGERVAS